METVKDNRPYVHISIKYLLLSLLMTISTQSPVYTKHRYFPNSDACTKVF